MHRQLHYFIQILRSLFNDVWAVYRLYPHERLRSTLRLLHEMMLSMSRVVDILPGKELSVLLGMVFQAHVKVTTMLEKLNLK